MIARNTYIYTHTQTLTLCNRPLGHTNTHTHTHTTYTHTHMPHTHTHHTHTHTLHVYNIFLHHCSVVTLSCIALSGPSCPVGLSCDHACQATPTGGVCYCGQGYQLNPADNRTCEGKPVKPHLLKACAIVHGATSSTLLTTGLVKVSLLHAALPTPPC